MFYLPRPGDRVTVRTDAESVSGEVICFYLGTVTVLADDGHILMAAKRRVSPIVPGLAPQRMGTDPENGRIRPS